MQSSVIPKYERSFCFIITLQQLVFLTLLTNTGSNPLLQYLSVYNRFNTRHYHHFLFCHDCGPLLVWNSNGHNIGGFGKKNQTIVFPNIDANNIDASILLAYSRLNESLCFSSLFLATSYSEDLNHSVSCNNWNKSTNISSGPISQNSLRSDSVVIDYIFAKASSTAALAYHGLVCKTTEPEHVWIIDDDSSISVSATKPKGRTSYTDKNGVRFVAILLDISSHQRVSFLSVSYMLPQYSTISVKCTATGLMKKASVTLINVSASNNVDSTTQYVSTVTEKTVLFTKDVDSSHVVLERENEPKQQIIPLIAAIAGTSTTTLILLIVVIIVCIKLKKRKVETASGEVEPKIVAGTSAVKPTQKKKESEYMELQDLSGSRSESTKSRKTDDHETEDSASSTENVRLLEEEEPIGELKESSKIASQMKNFKNKTSSVAADFKKQISCNF